MVERDNFLVSFIGRSRESDRKINRDSLDLAPPGTYTNAMEERYKMKKGDLFDCCDDYGIWYRASVLDRFESEEKEDCEGNPI